MVITLHKTLYIYKGLISYPAKLTIVKDILDLDAIKEAKPDFRKKMRYVADECITNIITYYGLNKLSDKNCTVKIIGSQNKIEAFEFENYLLTKDEAGLKEKISHINKAGIPEKKNLFIDTLKKDLDKDAKGAGLGILTLKQKFNYELIPSFTKAGGLFSKFKLKVIISD